MREGEGEVEGRGRGREEGQRGEGRMRGGAKRGSEGSERLLKMHKYRCRCLSIVNLPMYHKRAQDETEERARENKRVKTQDKVEIDGSNQYAPFVHSLLSLSSSHLFYLAFPISPTVHLIDLSIQTIHMQPSYKVDG